MRRAALITGVVVGVLGILSTVLVLTLGGNRGAAEPSVAAAFPVSGVTKFASGAIRNGANSLTAADNTVTKLDDLVKASSLPRDDLAKPANHTKNAKATANKILKERDDKVNAKTKGRAKSESERKTLRDRAKEEACKDAKQQLFQELLKQLEDGQQKKSEQEQKKSEQDLKVSDLAQGAQILCELA